MALPTHARPTGNPKPKIPNLPATDPPSETRRAQSPRGASNLLISLGLFLLALLPRAYDLPRFVTADEAKWVYRSAQFLSALLRGDFPATSVNLTPAVTTTWLGSAGLAIYYQLHQATLNQPFLDWLNSLPEFRVQLDILVAARWPMVILTSLAVVALYLIAARLFHPLLAFLAAVFVALDPHPVALSHILGHDAPAAVFMSLSLLLLLLALKRTGEHAEGTQSGGRRVEAIIPLLLSGIAAGLAFLSKAPTLFLIPFAGLVFFVAAIPFFRPVLVASLRRPLVSLVLWIAVAYLTFVVVWPAAWVDPLGRPAAVFQNAFISATDQEEASEEGFWRVPDLGPFYYLVNGGFKLSPLVLVGAGLAVFFIAKRSPHQRISAAAQHDQPSPHVPHASPVAVSPCHRVTSAPLLWLLTFILLFTLFMTLSDKRSPRYILPVFPILGIIAAYGWLKLVQVAGSKVTDNIFNVQMLIFIAILTFAAGAVLLPYAPYYFTYYNPLLGGAYTAPAWVKIGWGEGLDQVGRFLQREGGQSDTRVGAAYASTVAPFFEGKISNVTSQNLDYVVLYLKQVQSGEPFPEFISYFERLDPVFSVNLNGIHYADVYPGPALQPVNLQSPHEASNLYPLAFRPLTVYGHIGETLEVDVVWRASDPLPNQPVNLTLAAAEPANSSANSAGATISAQGVLTRITEDVAVSRHQLFLPDTLAPGAYALLVEGQSLGEVELRNFKVPESLSSLQNLVFGQQIAVVAFAMTPDPDYIGLTLALQAQQTHLPDYTVFVQLLNAETDERAAGVDLPPHQGAWPTSRWVKGEVVTDEYLVAVPPDFKPGVYKIIVGLYQPETGQRLTLPDGQDHWMLPYSFIRD